MLGTTIPALHVSSFNPSSNLISTYLISAVMYVFRWRKPRRGKVKLLSTFPLLVNVMLSVNSSHWILMGLVCQSEKFGLYSENDGSLKGLKQESDLTRTDL